MSNLVTDYGCQIVPGTNQMPLQFSPIWRCNFLHFGLQLLVILLYNKHIKVSVRLNLSLNNGNDLSKLIDILYQRFLTMINSVSM